MVEPVIKSGFKCRQTLPLREGRGSGTGIHFVGGKILNNDTTVSHVIPFVQISLLFYNINIESLKEYFRMNKKLSNEKVT